MRVHDHLILIKSYIVLKDFMNNLIYKALPVGTIRQRQSGKYQKQESGEWTRIKTRKPKKELEQKTVDLSNDKERYDFSKKLAEDYEAGKLPENLNKLIDAEKEELLGKDTIADAINDLLKLKENKLFDNPEFMQWAKKRGLKEQDKAKDILQNLPKNLKQSTPEQNKAVINHLKSNYSENELEKRKDLISQQIDRREKELTMQGKDFRKIEDRGLGNLHHNYRLHENVLDEMRQEKLDKKSEPKGKVNIQGYWNGKIYGDKDRGYRIYVDNKEQKITESQAKYIQKNKPEIEKKAKEYKQKEYASYTKDIPDAFKNVKDYSNNAFTVADHPNKDFLAVKQKYYTPLLAAGLKEKIPNAQWDNINKIWMIPKNQEAALQSFVMFNPKYEKTKRNK